LRNSPGAGSPAPSKLADAVTYSAFEIVRPSPSGRVQAPAIAKSLESDAETAAALQSAFLKRTWRICGGPGSKGGGSG
jgi:hypothetical protein